MDDARWRDKLEIRLDNRQVFFLFFGSALVACMLFVLGVMVGKRIESRGEVAARELADPLTALDRGREPPPGVAAPDLQLTFPNALIGGPKAKPSASRSPGGSPRAIKAPPAPKPTTVAGTPVRPSVAIDAAKAKGKYTLQINTFATRDDADAFIRKYPGAFVVAGAGDVAGKASVYRVRFGNFASYKEAAAAKDAFEKQHGTIALVAAR